jgi:hypothetical protein
MPEISNLKFVLILGLCACAATGPRILEVTGSVRTATIRPADEDLFVGDRATRFRFEPVALPAGEQRQEFLVRWARCQSLRLVRFEYRQVQHPNQTFEKQRSPERQCWTVFQIQGDEFITGGPVTAWRVSLWDEAGNLLAEKKSALW